jgi:tetratricopeptide (TPR) repeat protein
MARIISDPNKPAPRPEPVAAPLPRRQAGRVRVGWYVVGLICLVQFGLIGGWLFTHYYHPAWLGPAEQQVVINPKEPDPDAVEPLRPGEIPTVERGDQFLQEGRYDLALKVYDPLAATASGALRDALAYRVALAYEGLGRADDGLKAYRKVAGTERPVTRAAAEIGQARLLIRQRRASEAKAVLYPLLLRSGTPELRDQPYLADARYLLALALTLEAVKPEQPGPLSGALAEYTLTDWPVEAALAWVAPPKEEKEEGQKPKGEGQKTEAKDANFVGVERSGPDSMRVTANVSEGTLAHLIDRLAERARLKVDWTEAAKKAAGERGAAVNLQELPVGDVLLDLILPLVDPLGLVATVKDGTLRLATDTETTSEALTAYRAAMARRALTGAIAGHPGHRLTPAAYLELANLDGRAGKLKEAAARYDRLAFEFRHSPLLVEASYNLGMLRLEQWQTTEARAAFYAARDHAPGHELAPLAFLQVGRTYLLDGDPEQAVKPLKEALANSAGTPIEPAVALTLAAAYLLAEKPREGTRVVREHRTPVEQPPYRATAVFLDAYGQLLAVKGKASAHEASEVLAALWGVEQKEPVLGAVGALLIGHAYRDLDQPGGMIATYTRALPALKGAVADEMAYEVAEDLYRHEKRTEARKLYLPLSKAEGGRWAAPARLRLAEIALLDDRPQEALQACRKLLEDKQPVKRETVLLLMGQAYERAGEYRKAADCFKGQVPE